MELLELPNEMPMATRSVLSATADSESDMIALSMISPWCSNSHGRSERVIVVEM